MGPNTRTARIAGLLYLVVAIGSGLAFGIRSRLLVPGDAPATLARLAADEGLFRLSILGDLIGQIAFALLPFVLYALLRGVSRIGAASMVILAVVPVPIALGNLQHLWAALALVRGGGDAARLTACLDTFSGGVLIAQVFWGLWLLPFGWLVYASRFLPRSLGVLVMLGSVGYLLGSFGKLLAPGSALLASAASWCTLESAIGELAILFWLLVKGVAAAQR